MARSLARVFRIVQIQKGYMGSFTLRGIAEIIVSKWLIEGVSRSEVILKVIVSKEGD